MPLKIGPLPILFLFLQQTTPRGVVSILLFEVSSHSLFRSVTVTLPASTNFQYKYIRIFNGAITWESDPNNSNTTPATGTFVINDTWR